MSGRLESIRGVLKTIVGKRSKGGLKRVVRSIFLFHFSQDKRTLPRRRDRECCDLEQDDRPDEAGSHVEEKRFFSHSGAQNQRPSRLPVGPDKKVEHPDGRAAGRERSRGPTRLDRLLDSKVDQDLTREARHHREFSPSERIAESVSEPIVTDRTGLESKFASVFDQPEHGVNNPHDDEQSRRSLPGSGLPTIQEQIPANQASKDDWRIGPVPDCGIP